MKKLRLIIMVVVAAMTVAALPLAFAGKQPRTFKVTAEYVAFDNVTHATVATGNVEAVSEPLHIRTQRATRDAEGVTKMESPSSVTTCTNTPGICHWSLSGEVEYLDKKYIIGRNVWLEFYELPIFWLPYFYYPLEGECSFRIMPGYTESWGAYLMTKYMYPILGDRYYSDVTWWLRGDTRLDLRYVNGIALGENLEWNLGDYGAGYFKLYYAWDENYDEYDNGWYSSRNRYCNWGSKVNRNRYQMELSHRWDMTERDILRLRGMITSDSFFNEDFFRNDFWTIENDWHGHDNNELAWERNESIYGTGISVSGPLNEFYGGTARLPEIYFDLVPMPVFDLPINYETENRLGYLRRQAAEIGNGDRENPFSFVPGPWASYESFRFDSYHRLTAPFKTMDVVSVVPRLGYRATAWNQTGETDLTGWEYASNAGAAFRSIGEAGVTFAGRGKANFGNGWQHTLEPYLDVLAQKAWYDGISDGNRAYVFDNLDASIDWQDQFAGRSRNLPYTYYGVTPGLRNAFDRADEKGNFHKNFDLDVYAALQFNHAEWDGENDNHKLAVPGYSNYGKSDAYVSPGFRTRWFPDDSAALMARLEYDPDYNRIAMADLDWHHQICENFSYYIRYASRNYRMWDFSSTPYSSRYMTGDDMNLARYDYGQIGFENHLIDWFQWSPFLRWDCRTGEMDRVGSWFDYLTDCIGFRLIVEYRNSFTRIDGSEHKEDVHIGFYIYLRAIGPNTNSVFN